MIQIKNCSTNILKDISITIPEGSVNGLIGPSGAGKTTLIRAIASLENILSGQIFIDKEETCSMQTSQNIGFVFQSFHLFENMTALENILYTPLKIKKINKEYVMNLYNSLIKTLKIEEIIHRYPASLSGGQRQRVALARALILEPKIMLLDEPTSALDPENTHQIKEEVAMMKSKNITVIIVSHDIHFIKDVSDNIIFLKAGRVSNFSKKDLFFEKYHGTDNGEISSFLNRILR